MPSMNRAMMDSILESSFAMKMAEKLLDFVSKIPESHCSQAADAASSSAKLKQRSCMKAAATSAALAIPVGPIGWLTIVPELLAVWRIQAHMVADIAAMHGHSDKLTKEVMLYCLFNHSAKQALKDVTARVGERAFLRSTSSSMARQITARVGTRFTQKAVQRMVTRWVPVIGALGMGAYVYYDTHKVAATTINYFANPFPINDENLAEIMDKAQADAGDSENKVDQLADTVKKKAEDLASKAKDQWQSYRDSSSDAKQPNEKQDTQKGASTMSSDMNDKSSSKQAAHSHNSDASTMPQGQDAQTQNTSNDSPIVAGNHSDDSSSVKSTASSASTSSSSLSASDKTATDGNKSAQAKSESNVGADSKSAKDDVSSKSLNSVPPTASKSSRDQPHNGLYQ